MMRFLRLAKLALIMLTVIGTLTLLLQMTQQLKTPVFRTTEEALRQNQPLLNLTNFHLVTSPRACHPEEVVKALVIITSHSGNTRARMAWRNGLPTQILAAMNVRRVFLLGTPRQDQKDYLYVAQNQVLEEASNHSDILQGSFLEDYHNLTYKHAMGLRWAFQFCSRAQMLIKIDDDIATNLPRLLALAPPLLKNASMIGSTFSGTPPMRNGTKWRISLKEWPLPFYPTYLSGWLYITTPSIASKLLSALGTDFFWIDDIFITGMGSERAKVSMFDIKNHFTIMIEDIKCCQQGGGCDFMVAPTLANWTVLEDYLKLTLTTAANRIGRGNCNATQQQPNLTTSQSVQVTRSTQSAIVKNTTTK